MSATTVTTPQELATANPLDDARAQLRCGRRVARATTRACTRMLATPRREITVGIPLRRDDGRVEVFIGHRVQHNFSRGPAKGGLRLQPARRPRRGARAGDVDDLEVRAARRALRRRQGRRAHRPAPVLARPS